MRVILFSLLLIAAPASAQERSAIGDLLLSIKTKDGRPVVGTAVVVKRQDANRAEVVGTTDATGTARVPASSFEADAPVQSTTGVAFSAGEDNDIPELDDILEEIQADLADIGLDGLLVPQTQRLPDLRPRGAWSIHMPVVVLSDDPRVACAPSGFTVNQGWASGCGSSDAVPWGEGSRYEFEVDTGCTAEGRGERVTGIVTGGYLFPGTDTSEEDRPRSRREADFLRPLLLQFPDDLSRSGLTPPPGCAPDREEPRLPETSVFGLHGYNIDFGDGSWGLRGVTALPFLDDRPLGIAAGLDYYPQTSNRSTTALNVDVSCHFPWEALGDATAFVGGGLRAYRQTSDNGVTSSANTEFGAGLVSGMTYPLGPVDLYGDVGIDRIYGSFVPVTHFGVGVSFGE
ncbi:MAG: hypothetical protein Rubg2KO_07450 [Rubricoccaceae bacterium]